MKKIAIIGSMRSGKDTAADFLINHVGADRATKCSFGDKVKEATDIIFGPSNIKNRQQLIHVGQSMRAYDPLVWIKHVKLAIIKARFKSKKLFIVADCRQQNEYEFLKEQGFKFIYIDAPREEIERRLIELGETSALTELDTELEQHMKNFKYDARIVNKGNKEKLYHCLEIVYNYLGE